MEQEYNRKLLSANKKHNKFNFEEPIPSSQYCTTCKLSFSAFYDHIDSKEHLINQKQNAVYYDEIDDVISCLKKEKCANTLEYMSERVKDLDFILNKYQQITNS